MRQNTPKALRFFFVLMVATLLSSRFGFSQTYTTILSSDIDSVEVGDVFYLNVKIQVNQQVDKLILPDSSALPPNFEWLGMQQFKVTDFADSLKIKVQNFGSQDVFISGLPIGFVNNGDTTLAFTNSLIIPFKSVLASQTENLKPIKPIFSFKGFPWALLLIVLAVIAAALATYFTIKSRQTEPTVVNVVKTEPFISPLIELEQTLTSLKNDQNLAQTLEFKQFYSTVSDSLRKYYEDLYGIPALESTTREVLRFTDAFGVDLEMIKLTRTVLNKSDMVKFAKFTPTLDGAWACYNDAITFLERATLIDADRIARKKADYEAEEKMTEANDSEFEESEKEPNSEDA